MGLSVTVLTKFILAAIFPPIIIPFDPIGGDSTVEIDFEPLGGFDVYCPNTNLIGHLKSTKYYPDAREKLSVAVYGSDFTYFQYTARHTLLYSTTYDVVFTLPLSTMFSSAGISVRVQSFDEHDNQLAIYAFTLKPSPHKKINVNDYISTTYDVNNVVIDPDRATSRKREAVYFPSILSYFNEDYYYRLNLNGLLVNYQCFMPFPGCSAKLTFVDYDHIFRSLDSKDEVPIVEIPLQFVANTGQISFKFPDKMYVNPTTLDMSLTPKSGFQETSHFYLPVNRKNSLIDQVFTFEVTNFGYAKTAFSYDITYVNNRSLIGDCENSDYCVVGDMN